MYDVANAGHQTSRPETLCTQNSVSDLKKKLISLSWN